MNIEQSVMKHYGREGLAESILERARARAGEEGALTSADLSAFDEMHVGGRRATEYLFAKLQLSAGMKVLDIGSGIGGAARYAAENFVIEVTGIDLTPEYRDAAETLSEAVGLSDRLHFIAGNALEMPFEDESFDAAYTIHAAMNIQNKHQLYQEAARVLKPGAVFGVYDIMAGQDKAQMRFPVPWAEGQNTSFLLSPREVEEMAGQCGFEVIESESRRDFGLAALGKLLKMEAAGAMTGRSPAFPERVRNLVDNIEHGFCAPHQMVFKKVL